MVHTDFALRRPVTTLMVFAAVAVIGLVSSRLLPLECGRCQCDREELTESRRAIGAPRVRARWPDREHDVPRRGIRRSGKDPAHDAVNLRV